MGRDRPGSDTDGIVVALLAGAAKRHARWRDPTPDEAVAAVSELRELADWPEGGRSRPLRQAWRLSTDGGMPCGDCRLRCAVIGGAYA